MDTHTLIAVPFAALGLLVGLLVGLTGVGGGSLMTPLLILLFGIHPVTAVGTDLLFAAATKSLGTFVNGLSRTIEWRVVGLLAAGSLPATAVTLFVMSNIDTHNPTFGTVIRVVLVIAMLLTSVTLVARTQVLAFVEARRSSVSPRRTATLTIVTGAFLGVIVSLTSVGAGALGIIALLVLYPKFPLTRLIGSDIAHAVPLTLLAGIGHWMLGSVDWVLLRSLLAGSLPGILIGCYAAPRVPEMVLRLVLAITLVAVAAQMVF